MMETQVTFNLQQLCNAFLTICGGIAAVGVAIGWIVKAVNVAKGPNKRQNERLDAIEEKMVDYDKFFLRDKERLDEIEAGNRVTQRALLALLSHGIDGNDVDSMKVAKQELTDFLTRK